MSQEVVNIQAGAGNGWRLIETSMRSMPVVAVGPREQLRESFGGVLVEPGVGPFADGGLDEPFGFAVGAWGVDACANVFDLQFAASCGKAIGAEARAVVGHDASNGYAQSGEVGHGLAKEAAGRQAFFIR